MRHLLIGSVSALLVACAQFGADDAPPKAEESPPPGTPQDNATPPTPVDGSPAPAGVFVSASRGSDSGSGSK